MTEQLPTLAAPTLDELRRTDQVVGGVVLHDGRFPHLQVTHRCLCGCPQQAHTGKTFRGSCSGPTTRVLWHDEGKQPAQVIDPAVPCPDGCRRYRRDPADLVVERALQAVNEPLSDGMTRHDRRRLRSRKSALARRHGRWGVGPSDIGGCRKRIEYRERPPADYVPGPEDRSAAVLGTWMHEGWTRLVRSLYPWRQVKLKVLVPGFDEPGEIDAYDPILHVIDDLKTCGEYAWETVGKLGPRVDDVDQAMLYGLGLEEAGVPVEYVRIEYLRRANGQSERWLIRYSRERALQAAGRLHAVIDALELGIPLQRDYDGPTLDGRCRACPAVRHCWSIDEAEAVGRTPEGWLLAREDSQVEAALASYVDAHGRETPTKREKERVKVLVEGVEWGVYGEYSYRKTGGRTEWVEDERARAEQLADAMRAAREAGTPPPDPDGIPAPQRPKTSSQRVEIKRLRAAEIAARQTEAAAATSEEEPGGSGHADPAGDGDGAAGSASELRAGV